MTTTPDPQTDSALRFLRQLAGAHARIAGDVVQIGEASWAIHGVIAIDGDELLAGFASYDAARVVLDRLPV
jgi:hypothetical protein